jgi:hypothetical protein
MSIKIEDLVPVIGMMNGKGWAGDMFGKKSRNEAAEQAAANAAKAEADQKAAAEQAAQRAQAAQWANRPAMKKGGAVKKKMAEGGKVMSQAEKEAREEMADKKMREKTDRAYEASRTTPYKKGGMVGSSASRRADGMASKGKTRGKMC